MILLALCAEFIWQLHLDWSLNPSYSYGWLVPILAIFLFVRSWPDRPDSSPPRLTAPVFALLATSAFLLFPLRLIAKANPDWRLVSWILVFSLAAIAFSLLALVGGSRWVRHFAFPILFCLVAVPWPSQFEQTVVQQLMRLVAGITVGLLTFLGIAAFQMGNIIQLSTGWLGVEDACSGIRSLQSTLMLSLFLGAYYSLRWSKRLLLIAAGGLLALAFNIVRTFFLAWMASRNGIPSIARWHDAAGWSVMLGCLFGLWGLCLLMKGDASSHVASPAQREEKFPFRAVIALGCWLFFIEGFSEIWFRSRENISHSAPQWVLTWPGEGEATEIQIPAEAADLLHYNEGRAISWRDDEGKQWNLFFLKWMPGRTAALFVKIHRPEICLPASGLTGVGEPRSQLLEVNGVALPTRAYRFQDRQVPLHVYYCYWDGTVFRDTQQMIEEDWTVRGRLYRSWTGKREQGAQTLEMAVWGHASDEAADAALKKQLARLIKG